MDYDLPRGYWAKGQDAEYLNIGFQYGGHIGGECEIFLPKEMLNDFINDRDWRNQVTSLFYRITSLGPPGMEVPLPKEELGKDGIVPRGWEPA